MTTRQNQTYGIALGLAVTAVTAAVALTIGTQFERQALDLRFQLANHIQPDARIVHVDIDDDSIERIGRWPWPRDLQADLIRVLRELGASTIAVDLLLDNKERPRVPDLEHLAPEELSKINEENIVWPDLELADAIRRAGNVVLSASFDIVSHDAAAAPRDVALDYLRETPNATVDQLAERLRLSPSAARPLWLTARLTVLLLERFDLSEQPLAERIGVDVGVISPYLAGAKRAVASQLAENFLGSNPNATVEELLAHLRLPPGTTNLDSEDIRQAFERERAFRALCERSDRIPAALRPIAAGAVEVIAPLASFSQAADGVGFVYFKPDPDGTLREMPLLADYRGYAIEQLGFNVACRVLGAKPESMRFTQDGYLEIPTADAAKSIRVQLDSRGRMVIPWTATGRRWRQGGDFRHVPAAKLLTIGVDRDLIRENTRRIDNSMRALIDVTKKEFGAKYADLCEELLRLNREQHRDRLLGRDATPEFADREKQIVELRADIDQRQAGAEAMVETTATDASYTPETPEEKKQFDQYKAAYALMTGPIAQLREANKKIDERIKANLAELRPILADKIVFVGYTATATGDVVSTPVDPTLPGVIVHATILNAFLHNTFIVRPNRALQLGLILALGIGATMLTATRGPIMTLFVTLGVMVIYTLLNFFALFADMRLWVVLVAPLATCIVPWAIVTAWRQLTAERQKRHVQSQLAEFTSPALARRVAEDPAAAAALNRVENREVTCFFSDLAGFTTIAEQADSAHVQEVLNTYLDRMSEVLFKYDAFLNKFLGDGIMAFFNPNVNPQPEHARLACEASLDSFDALEKLKAELGGHDELYKLLKMRIGLASGIGGVGRFGSHRKADYTVIGDVANLAARLEPANKVFGTRLLVSGPTREIVKDLYDWRYLAELQVKGKKLTVPVYELICRAGSLTDEQREFNQRFEAGVELYKQRKWDDAIVAFMRILSRRFDEPGASAYVDACQEKKSFPPEDGWNGALELKEK